MLKKIILIATGVGTIGAFAILHLTTPATIHPIGLLVFFICVYAVVLGLVTVLSYFTQRSYYRFIARRKKDANLTEAYEYATVIALGPVILLALQTVGRLQFTDVLFTALFVGLGCFYVMRRRG